jgi:hypothetical protein
MDTLPLLWGIAVEFFANLVFAFLKGKTTIEENINDIK